MKQVKKSVLLWYTPQEMYELVTQVEAYPEFLPWCDQAQVLERHADGLTAKLGAMWSAAAAGTTLLRLYLIPAKTNDLPADVRLAPTW